MLATGASNSDPSLNLIEAGIMLVGVALSFAAPGLGSTLYAIVERSLTRLARRRGLSIAAVGLSAVVLRLAILPFCPVPLPFSPNDFSNLLAADTFAHGRLANPTPAMWVHFETIHVSMVPSYVTMYFPTPGLVLAAGKVLFGNPWFGELCLSGLMCGAICWMLQSWLPPGWALLGGSLAVLRIGLFSYWIDTYSGGGLTSAFGGALVLGALRRIVKARAPRHRDGMLLALGIVLLATTRPFEGLLLCLPVAAALIRWAFFSKNRPKPQLLLRRSALPLALVTAAAVGMGYYDKCAFGSAATLPYTVDRATYAVAPYFFWQPQRPDPGYRHASLRRFYYGSELPDYLKMRSVPGFLKQSLVKAGAGLLFFAGFALLPPLFLFWRALLDRRMHFLSLCLLILVLGMLIQIYFLPHYVAPFTAAFYAVGLQAMRHLRLWKTGGKPVGLAIVRVTVAICILLAGVRVLAGPLSIRLVEWPSAEWIIEWYGPGHFGQQRAEIESSLEKLPGKQLVLVRYAASHNPMDEWVYNAAQIDSSKVIWARDMDSGDNSELIHYYKDRRVWLAEPDTHPARLSPYVELGAR